MSQAREALLPDGDRLLALGGSRKEIAVDPMQTDLAMDSRGAEAPLGKGVRRGPRDLRQVAARRRQGPRRAESERAAGPSGAGKAGQPPARDAPPAVRRRGRSHQLLLQLGLGGQMNRRAADRSGPTRRILLLACLAALVLGLLFG